MSGPGAGLNLSFVQLLGGSIGALLIYCAIANKTPVAAIKDAFNANQGNPGVKINPIKTGQASTDGSSGHNMNVGGTQLGDYSNLNNSGQ